MDDMTAFERQVQRRVHRFVGPARPVDDLAIFEAVATASRSPRWGFTMFSALKFIAASVIVALFGGFLLVGILTTQQDDEMAPAAVTESPSPMTTEDLLSGMVTEEVEPGVYRVDNDGVRDLGPSAAPQAVGVDGAGAVGLLMDRTYFLLGADEERRNSRGRAEDGDIDFADLAFEAAVDGRFQAEERERLLGPDSERWTEEVNCWGDPEVDVTVQGDGTLWLLGSVALLRARPDGIPELIDWAGTYDGEADCSGVSVTADGEGWLKSRSDANRNLIDAFLHFDGSDWEVVPAPDDAGPARGPGFDVGPAGTLWSVADTVFPHRSLARYDESGWTIYDDADGVQPWGGQPAGYFIRDMVRVAPDGSAWVNAAVPGDYLRWEPADWMEEEGYEQLAWTDDWNWDVHPCDGLGRFDGERWMSFLPGMCIADYDFAPDGAVWVVARDSRQWLESGAYLYVITPEAAS